MDDIDQTGTSCSRKKGRNGHHHDCTVEPLLYPNPDRGRKRLKQVPLNLPSASLFTDRTESFAPYGRKTGEEQKSYEFTVFCAGMRVPPWENGGESLPAF